MLSGLWVALSSPRGWDIFHYGIQTSDNNYTKDPSRTLDNYILTTFIWSRAVVFAIVFSTRAYHLFNSEKKETYLEETSTSRFGRLRVRGTSGFSSVKMSSASPSSPSRIVSLIASWFKMTVAKNKHPVKPQQKTKSSTRKADYEPKF